MANRLSAMGISPDSEVIAPAAVPLDSNKRKKETQELDVWNPDMEDKTISSMLTILARNPKHRTICQTSNCFC
jgi:hypothetical protein